MSTRVVQDNRLAAGAHMQFARGTLLGTSYPEGKDKYSSTGTRQDVFVQGEDSRDV